MKTQSPTNIAQNAARRNLAQLNRMRWIAVAGQLLAIWGTVVLLDVDLNAAYAASRASR